ncbi:MAG: sugar ABC transporter ATP-binding protein [Actinobacteria bacterium]|nr:sugar ABC transporter ATP-binding protein [Actinomycetota bacterium]
MSKQELASQSLQQKHLLDLKNISKTFSAGRPVLKNVDFSVIPSEIHALAGANGSGKSTLVKILAGYHAPDPGGEIFVDGQPVNLPVNPHEIRLAGVRFVHQDNGFISGMSVLDNMCLGRGYSFGPLWKIKWNSERTAIEQELKRHGVHVDLDSDAKTLSVATKAQLAIIRALYCREGEFLKVVVLDEPTAAMGREEASNLGVWLQELATREGIGVLFIGHRPQELREIADRVSVLRNGELVATFRSDEIDSEGIVEALVGARIGSFYPDREDAATEALPKFTATSVSGKLVSDVSFSLYPGEIVGITGLQGSGYEELPYLLFDKDRRGTGKIVHDGVEIDISNTSITEHIKRGMVLVPGDRVNNSVITELTICENISQPKLRQFKKGGFLRAADERSHAAEVATDFGVTPVGVDAKIGSLSGGNQQKVAVGKWMSMNPEVILLHEPTEGIDVLAKREIFRILSAKAAAGAAILVSTIEYEDLAHICDRILICGHGKIQMELKGSEITGEEVLRAAYRASLVDDDSSDTVTWTAG